MGSTISRRQLSWYDYTFIWCEESFDESQLPAKWIKVKNVYDADECQSFFVVASKKNIPIVLIVHESLAKQTIPKVYSYSQLIAIYVYSPTRRIDPEWFHPYDKVTADRIRSSVVWFLFDVGKGCVVKSRRTD